MLVQWKQQKSGIWESSGNWDTHVPTAADEVTIASTGKKFTVALATDASFSTLNLTGKVTMIEEGTASMTQGLAGGVLIEDRASLILNADNPGLHNYLAVRQGLLQVGAEGALGTAQVLLSHGATLRTTTDYSMTNLLRIGMDPAGFNTNGRVQAAHDTRLTIKGSLLLGADLLVGAADYDGTVVLAAAPGEVYAHKVVDVQGGTLALGSNGAAKLFHRSNGKGAELQLESNATFDLAGHKAELDRFEANGGAIVNSGKSAALLIHQLDTILASDITGEIQLGLAQDGVYNVTGAVDLDGHSSLFVGAGTAAYFAHFGIRSEGDYVAADSGSTLTLDSFYVATPVYLGQDATLILAGSGTIYGNVDLSDGAEVRATSGSNVHVAGTVTGDGIFSASGATLQLDGSNHFTGINEVDASTLILSRGDAIGTGITVLDNVSTLATTATTTIASHLVLWTATVAAQHATTLTLSGQVDVVWGNTLKVGVAGYDGTVEFKPNADSSITGEFEVQAGTLLLGNSKAADLVAAAGFVQVDAGATLDLHGQYPSVQELTGTGTILNNGPNYDSLSIASGDFGGTITGGIAVQALGDITLSGTGSFDALYIDDGASATLGGAASERIYMYDGAATLILGASASLTGKISSFAAGDAIRLEALHYGAGAAFTYDAATRKLTVTDGSHSVAMTFQDNHAASDFSLVQAGDGSIEVHANNAAATPHDVLPSTAFAHLDADHAAAHLAVGVHLDLHQLLALA